MSRVGDINVELQVVLGGARLPLGELLRLGQGSTIALSAQPADEVWLLANEHAIARGQIRVDGGRISIAITRAATAAEFALSQFGG